MKAVYLILALPALLAINSVAIAQDLWKPATVSLASKGTRHEYSGKYQAYTTDQDALKKLLSASSAIPANGQIIQLPMAGGAIRSFRVWSSSLLPPALQAKYPELRAFTAEAVDNRAITAKLDFTSFGFHAMIFNGTEISLIDPLENGTETYVVHNKRDEQLNFEDQIRCLLPESEPGSKRTTAGFERKSAERVGNGNMLRTYRLALSCSHLYAQAATGLPSPTTAQVLSKMMTTMNRVNGVYERELSITMNFVANEDTLIWTVASGGFNGPDPFSSIDTDPAACINANQIVCDTFIGTNNYDIGHVFTTGAGGQSIVGVVCNVSYKAQSVTGLPNPVGDGFDIDFVTHEMGHEYGADHTFNNGVDHSCGRNNINEPTAYEPGSGSTIMAYAGICAPDDLQLHSDAYFHAASLTAIQQFITTLGDGCSTKTTTSNKLVSIPSFTATYTIPYLTPFELTAPVATDSVADSATTYCWEEWNLGDAGSEFKNTHYAGPIFRSYFPTLSPTRIFPQNSMVLAGSLSNVGTEGAESEKAPDVARFLTFILTVRDIYQGTGCFLIPDDSIHLDVINTGSGFSVTSQNTAGSSLVGNSTQQITWNVAGTNVAPINTASVDIYMSADGGNTWTYHIGNFLNNGSAIVTLPNPDTTITRARIKVKGSANVFFNVNSRDFEVTHGSLTDTAIKIYPVPAHTALRVSSGNKGQLQLAVFNSVGQLVYKGDVNGELDIPVSLWARGTYFLKLVDIKNQHTIRKFVVQ